MKSPFTAIIVLVAAAAVSAQPVELRQYLTEVQRVQLDRSVPAVVELCTRLDDQVSRLVAAGHMAPWRVQPGETESYFYFTDPYELVLILSRARPCLSPAVAAQAAEYLARHIAEYPVGLVALLPHDQGRFREVYDLPPEQRTFRYRRWLWRSLNTRPRMMAFYAMWAYADVFNQWAIIEQQYPQLVLLFEQQYGTRTNLLEEAVGLAAFARLATYMGDSARAERALAGAVELLAQQSSVEEMNRRARIRYDANTKTQGGRAMFRPLLYPVVNITPESARFLAERHKDDIRRETEQMMRRWPLWYVPLPPHGDPLFGEGCSMAPDIRPNILLSRAMVLEDPLEELMRDLDIPALPVGDLFYIQTLTALIERAGSRAYSAYQPPRRAVAFGPADEKRIEDLRQYLASIATAPWKISRPFPNPKNESFDRPLDPETGAVPGTAAGDALGWRDLRMSDHSADLRQVIDGDATGVLAYAWTRVYSPRHVTGHLLLRNDDPLAAWVNGREVLRNREGLGWMPGEDRAPVTLEEGWNTVLLKLDQAGGGWVFSAKFVTPGGAPLEGLRFSTETK
jgi:hypothetical protein